MFTFIGLSLYDERSISVEGQEALVDADHALTEFYTSRLVGATVEELKTYYDTDIEIRDHAGVEQDPGPILDAAEDEHVVFLIVGDAIISTTRVDLRLRAEDRGIETRLIHGVTAQSAASGPTELQNCRFGKTVTLPFPYVHGDGPVPKSIVDSLETNRDLGLHTLVCLDIKVDWEGCHGVGVDGDQYIIADYAVELFAGHWDADALGVAICRTGNPDLVVAAGHLSALMERNSGAPLHMFVIPGEVHRVKTDALSALGGAPEELSDDGN